MGKSFIKKHMILSSSDIANFKSTYSVNCIHVNCDPSIAKDKTLPRSAYLVHCNNGTEIWYDVVIGSKIDIFNAYYDKYGNVIKEKEPQSLLQRVMSQMGRNISYGGQAMLMDNPEYMYDTGGDETSLNFDYSGYLDWMKGLK